MAFPATPANLQQHTEGGKTYEFITAGGAWRVVDQSGAGATNLTLGTVTATTVDVNSSTGTDATLPAATTAAAGVLTAADKTRIDNLTTGTTGAATTTFDNATPNLPGAPTTVQGAINSLDTRIDTLTTGTTGAAAVTYNDTGIALPGTPTTVQGAIAALDGRIDTLGTVTGNFVGQAATLAGLNALTDPIGGGAPQNGDIAYLSVDDGGQQAGFYIRTGGAWPAAPFFQVPDTFTAANAILSDTLAGAGGAAVTYARSDHRHAQSRGAVLPATDGSAGIIHVLMGNASLPDGEYILLTDAGAVGRWVQV